MKSLGLILFSFVLLASCKKEAGSGCISQTTALPTVAAIYKDSIETLFKNNNISPDNKEFLTYNSWTTNDPGTPHTFFQLVTANQLSNGLPIFFSYLDYTFENGAPYILSGKVYGKANLDTHSLLSLSMLRQLAIEAINKQGINPTFKDSCFVAQFGYYDLNRASTADTTTSYVKAWEVHPAHSLYPQCYIRDDNGATLTFDSGIRPFATAKPRL
jgi:hypothetical protein